MSPSASSMKLSYVPDSSPGAVMSSGASGYGALSSRRSRRRSHRPASFASLQLAKPCDSGPRSAYRSPNERQVTSALFRRGDDGEAVDGDLQLDVLDAGLLAERDLFLVDRPRRVGDVAAVLAEDREAVAGAGAVDLEGHVRVRRGEVLERDRDDRLDGGRADGDDLARNGSPGLRGWDSPVRARRLGLSPVLSEHAASTSIDTTLTTSSDRHHLRFTFNPSSGVGEVGAAGTRGPHARCTREDGGRRLTNP